MATIFIGMGKPTFPVPYFFLNLGHELARRGHSVHLLMHHQRAIPEKQGNPAIHYWPCILAPQGFSRIFDSFFPYSRPIAQSVLSLVTVIPRI